jgi:hypothetical protein
VSLITTRKPDSSDVWGIHVGQYVIGVDLAYINVLNDSHRPRYWRPTENLDPDEALSILRSPGGDADSARLWAVKLEPEADKLCRHAAMLTPEPVLPQIAGPGMEFARWNVRQESVMLRIVDASSSTGDASALTAGTGSKVASAVLRVHRRDNPWRDWMIGYAVEADGKLVGEVMRGQSQDFVLVPGDHAIRIRTVGSLTDNPSRFYASRIRRFTIEDGDLVEVICGPNGPAILAVLSFFQFHRYINLERPRRFRSH